MNQVYGLNKRQTAEMLKERGINPTTQRIEIAHLIFQQAQHLSAEEILSRINKEYEQVSQATIYNTLRLFVDKKVIRELIFSPDRIYYDSNTNPHHHFIDIDTGKVFDLPTESVELCDLNIPMADAEILEVTLLIKGRLRSKN